MANIDTFTIPDTNDWIKLEDLIKEKYPDFAFESGITYQFQNKSLGMLVFAPKAEKPNDIEGTMWYKIDPFNWIQGSAPLWVKATSGDVLLNVSDNK